MFAVFAFLATLVGGGTWFYSQYQEQARVATKRQKEDARKAVEAAECQANAKAEAERKADEERARLTVEAAARAAATEIRIEAMVQNKKVEPISDEDGFKAYKDKLSDDFARAEACFDEKTKQWSEAAARFTNYVSQCKALVELHGEWQRAVASRTKAEAEKSRAAKAEAEKYASTNWNKAVGLWQKANARFKEMKFAESGNVFVSAARQFMQCADDAAAEQNRQKEEVEAKARKVAAERERRKSEEVEGTKIKKVTVGDTCQIVFACKDNGMWVTKDPISWKEYIAVVGEAPADFLDVNLPATNVSWEDCKVFADRFPMRVRLPNSDELREQVVTSSVRREWCSDDNNPSVAFAYDFSLARKYSFCKNSRNVDLGFRIVLND